MHTPENWEGGQEKGGGRDPIFAGAVPRPPTTGIGSGENRDTRDLLADGGELRAALLAGISL